MKKKFEEFTKLKIKDMCKTISDMTYTYIQPETKKPTEVPAKHYEDILVQPVEEIISESIRVQQLELIYKNLNDIQKNYKEEFFKSIMCMDLGVNPLDMSVQEQIALNATYNFMLEKQIYEKKKFRFINEEILAQFDKFKEDKDYQAKVIDINNNPFSKILN